MTAPQQPDQQQQQDNDRRDAIIAALVLWFGSAAAITATTLPTRLITQLVELGLSERAVRAAARATVAPPLTGRRRTGSPSKLADTTTSRAVATDEPLMRAQYLLKAVERLTEADQLGTFEAAFRMERRYLGQHLAAGRNRARAAADLDRVATEHGPWLVWVTANDSRVEADCRHLAGTVFTADHLPTLNGVPVIPGAVHPACRCVARGLFDHSQPPPTIQAIPTGGAVHV